MFAGIESAEKDPTQEPAHRRRRHARAGARRGVRRGDGVEHQLQHGVDVDLRAAADVRVPRPLRPREHVGGTPRAALPRRRIRRVGRRAAGRVGGAQLEARRPGHGPLQLRRRPGSVGPRRLDARRQPAHLGVRDQLRRPRRPDHRQGQPADAEADPPHVGGGGGQRAVQLDELPDARRAQRGTDEAGRRRAGVGRDRWHRRLRDAVRPQRRRHPRRRRVVTREGRAAPRARRRGGHRPQGRGLPLLVRRHDAGRVGVAAVRQAGPRPGRRRPRHRLRASRAARRWARRSSRASGAARW